MLRAILTFVIAALASAYITASGQCSPGLQCEVGQGDPEHCVPNHVLDGVLITMSGSPGDSATAVTVNGVTATGNNWTSVPSLTGQVQTSGGWTYSGQVTLPQRIDATISFFTTNLWPAAIAGTYGEFTGYARGNTWHNCSFAMMTS
jgi:hypothetical protein